VTLAGGVLAIVGLQDYARRKGHFKQGRAQAIWALVLSSLLWFSILALLAEVKWGFTGIRASPAGAKVMVFPEKNLKFFAPGGRWQLVETNNLGWNGTVMLERERPRMSFVLIAGEETKEGYSVADLAEAGLESVRRKVSGLDVTFRAETRLGWWGGFHEGLRLTCEAGEAQQRLYLDQRFFFTNGWSYHLTTWGSKEDRKQISQEAADLFQRFELLDFRPKSVIATNAVNQSL
jgi:hypothetical protein